MRKKGKREIEKFIKKIDTKKGRKLDVESIIYKERKN